MFVTNILNEFVNRSTCIYPISCLRLFMLIFISSISSFMLHLVHLVHLVTDMDVSIGNRTVWQGAESLFTTNSVGDFIGT